jgi:hypothetical protein
MLFLIVKMPEFQEIPFHNMIAGQLYYCFGTNGYYIGIFDHYAIDAKFKKVRFVTNEIIEYDEIMINNTHRIYKIVP